jgi:hypothetical protein
VEVNDSNTGAHARNTRAALLTYSIEQIT